MRMFPSALPLQMVTAFEMQRRPAAFQRLAMKAPITVTSNGSPTLVVMSVDEYQRLRHEAEGSAIAPHPTEDAKSAPVLSCAQAVARLQKHRKDLGKLGIAHVWLFGSFARDQADELSDVDIVVDTEDGRAPGLFLLSRLAEYLEQILGRSVDVISRRGLEHAKKLKAGIDADMIDVF